MSRLVQEEGGFTLIELMLVSVLMIVVIGATLATLTNVERTSATNQRQNENQEQVRRAVDSLARELRNLASPTDELPEAIGRATASDLIFQSVARTKPTGSANDRNTKRVRYCLDADAKQLWRQEQHWVGDTAPPMPTATECPAAPAPPSGWHTQTVAAENVVNAARPVFAYNSTEPAAITEIRASLFADATPGRSPGEGELDTSVFLRNQNRAPTAQFTAAASGLSILLNGSQSSDPEQKPLDYYWYDEDVTSSAAACAPLPPELPATGCVGKGIVFSYSPSPLGLKAVYLVVRDPAGLTHTAPTQEVCVIGLGSLCL